MRPRGAGLRLLCHARTVMCTCALTCVFALTVGVAASPASAGYEQAGHFAKGGTGEGLRARPSKLVLAPGSRFGLRLEGGRKGTLAVSGRACRRSRVTAVEIDGHNGKASDRTVMFKAPCVKAKKAKRRSRR